MGAVGETSIQMQPDWRGRGLSAGVGGGGEGSSVQEERFVMAGQREKLLCSVRSGFYSCHTGWPLHSRGQGVADAIDQ